MLSQKTAAAVLDAALRSGGDFAEIFLEDRRNNVLTMRSSRIENVNSNRLHGAGVRVYSGLSSVYVYTNDTSLEGLLDCAARAAAAISGSGKKAEASARLGCDCLRQSDSACFPVPAYGTADAWTALPVASELCI